MFDKKTFMEMKRPMKIMLISVGILFGAIFVYKTFINFMMKRYFAEHANPVMTVSAEKVAYVAWQPHFKAVGSLRSTLGVNVTAQISGMIDTIYFTPGSIVQQGAVLVQQNADVQVAQLRELQANAELAKITYTRDKAQYKIQGVSKQQLDTDEQNLKSAQAQVDQQQATVVKLTIRAPFTGRLGISKVNPGQYLNPGDTIVTLQSLDPIYVDFYLPQQALAQLQVGQTVRLVSDTFPDKTFTGKITTINPIVDVNTRNVEVEATIPNPKNELIPGMFANVEIDSGKLQSFLTVPKTAITFNPYGDIAYIVKEKGKDKKGKPVLISEQTFVETGESRGDQITVLQGLKQGDLVVTSGQLKLKNDGVIALNNTVQPDASANPKVTNEHTELD
jgi:membrane fusion protein (multidrug efflux system)